MWTKVLDKKGYHSLMSAPFRDNLVRPTSDDDAIENCFNFVTGYSGLTNERFVDSF